METTYLNNLDLFDMDCINNYKCGLINNYLNELNKFKLTKLLKKYNVTFSDVILIETPEMLDPQMKNYFKLNANAKEIISNEEICMDILFQNNVSFKNEVNDKIYGDVDFNVNESLCFVKSISSSYVSIMEPKENIYDSYYEVIVYIPKNINRKHRNFPRYKDYVNALNIDYSNENLNYTNLFREIVNSRFASDEINSMINFMNEDKISKLDIVNNVKDLKTLLKLDNFVSDFIGSMAFEAKYFNISNLTEIKIDFLNEIIKENFVLIKYYKTLIGIDGYLEKDNIKIIIFKR